MKYATFGQRLLAALIDSILIGFITSTFFGYGRYGGHGLVGAAYAILLWVNWNGQTLGKKVMKIKVIREDGKKLDYKTAVIRYLGYFLSSIPLLLGFLWVIWDEKKQAWHDKIAGTYVVKE